MILNSIWFVLIGFLFAGYAILDGFDLGVGAWHLFVRQDEDRRTLLNAIGPLWDGNEVWLITGGGALFASYPEAYATAFSGFYIPFMIFLAALIFRAVSIEFRSQQPGHGWRQTWDICFSLSSITCTVLLGVALGNLIVGVPLTPDHEYTGTFLSMLNPYSLLVGLTTLALFMMHGALFVVLRTEGPLQSRFRRLAQAGVLFFVVCYAIATAVTLVYIPRMAAPMRENPILFGIPMAGLMAIANIPRDFRRGRDWRAFLSSCAAVTLLLAVFGMGVFPNLVTSNPNPENSLTILNAASSPKTLQIMLVIAAIGMPLILAYTVSVHWIFRGKVKFDNNSY
jgi:cytochrome bd ubiquinol oxidase subunit II